MKKIVSAILSLAMFGAAAGAYNFPEPDWGALLNERKAMVTEADFELYVEGRADSAPYYGAKFEPTSGVYIGMTADSAESYKPLSSYLTYIQNFGQPDITYPANNMISSDDVVTMVGWTVDSLDYVDFDSMRSTLEKLNSYNKPMLVRFANEMNCSALGDDPDRYVQVFRDAANLIHEYPNLAVVWSPNDMGSLDRPFDYYYPGDEYVDWVGVSCYTTKYFQGNADTSETDATYFITGKYGWPTNKLKPFLDFLAKNNINKPVMISEGGVARSDVNGDNYAGWHEPRLRNMLWNVVMKYPQVKMINYFNVVRPDEFQNYCIADSAESTQIFKEAANSGAYLLSANASPKFVFKPANEGGTLTAGSDGTVKLYTLAYLPDKPDITVNYRIDGVWVHSANQIPYIFNLDVNSIADGAHTLSIDTDGASKEYTMYKSGQMISFGQEPDPSAAQAPSGNTNPAPQPAPSGNAPAAKDDTVTVLLNGEALSFNDQPPVIIEGRTLVPLRAIFEAMNATVEWDQSTATVTSTRGDVTVKMAIGDNTIYKNGTPTELDVPAQIINDRTMVPARAVAEAFGAQVGWDGDSRTVTINESPAEQTVAETNMAITVMN